MTVVTASETSTEAAVRILNDLDQQQGVSVSRLVQNLVSAGLLREQAVSLIHRNIAAGHLALTSSFLVTRRT